MCIKVQKPLNPKAEEWRPPPPPPPPASPLLPHAIYQPHPTSLSAPPPPHTELLPYHPHPNYTLLTHYPQCPQPVYTISFPSIAADSVAPPICEENPEKSEVKSAALKRAKCPRLKCPNKFLPPRLRRAIRSRTQSHSPPPPPPPKLKWRPKTSENSALKVSGGEGVAASPPKPKTTLMIKNIPNQLRRDVMLKFLDAHCHIHSLKYDFFYLPFDFRTRGNLGYAFVNCTTSDAAMKMKKVLDNFKWRSVYTDDGYVYSSKVCEMTWARIQGKEALLRRFQKSSFKCDDSEFLPVVLDPPSDGSDPNPPPPQNIGSLRP